LTASFPDEIRRERAREALQRRENSAQAMERMRVAEQEQRLQ
jgi:hypothetical protein